MNGNCATQRECILERLIDARGGWVPLPKIAACAAQYDARIHELRRMGFQIPAPRIETVNGQRHTWYPLELNARPIVRTRKDPSTLVDRPSTFPEFGDLARGSGYPD